MTDQGNLTPETTEDFEVNVEQLHRESSNIIKEKIRVEEFKTSSDTLIPTVQELIRQATIRRILVKTEEGYTLLEVPLTVGVVGGALGAAFFPAFAALSTVAALVTRVRIVVERAGG